MKQMTPLFDANAHPSLEIEDQQETFSQLNKLLGAAGFSGACAVGLPARKGFEGQAYLGMAETHGFFPVAAWNDVPEERIADQFAALAALGYRAIKSHPRLSGLSVSDSRFCAVLRAAAEAGFTVFHCCYQFSGAPRHPVDPLPALLDAITQAPNLKMVLLHGGTVEVLRYAEAIRSNSNLLLDLSFTINRYEGSSLDRDIAYLFRNFDRRLCVGTDYPDYQPSELRNRFETLAEGLAEEKRANIGWRNITSFLDLN